MTFYDELKALCKMYFVNALLYSAKNKFYATHVILDLISTVIKGYKDEQTDENAG